MREFDGIVASSALLVGFPFLCRDFFDDLSCLHLSPVPFGHASILDLRRVVLLITFASRRCVPDNAAQMMSLSL